LANAAGTHVDWESSTQYEALAAKPYNSHLNRWQKAIIDSHGKCLLCHDTACNTGHKTQDVLFLRKLV
jgi:hypothetical protein